MRYFMLVIYIIFMQNFLKAGYNLNFKDDDIGIVEFYREDHLLSFPVTGLYADNSLELRFDIFSVEREILYYSVQLYDYNWQAVDEDTYNYLEGYPENTLEPYSMSINTTVEYMHYRLSLPNQDINFLKAGNYVIRIYRQGMKDNPLLVRQFVVYEDMVSIDISFDKFKSESLETKQELSVKLSSSEVANTDLSGNIQLMVLQNNNWGTAKYYNKYNTSYSGDIEFNTPGQIVFDGINEFRFFDMKSFKFISERVSYNEYRAPYFHVILKPDKLLGDKEYFTREDLNGLFYIDNTDTEAEDILDADYARVHFTLETNVPLPADIYIEGALTDWQYQDNYMEFNPEKGVYEKELLLKQGLYNYRYVMREYDRAVNDYFLTEGEHYETRNNYLAILYYRKLGEIYYAPVGVTSYTTN